MGKARKVKGQEAMRTVEELLGKPGRMLYLSKSMGRPTTMFNALIFDSNAEQKWAGDMEILKDKEALIKISEQVGPIYVLYEGASFIKFTPDIKYIRSMAQVSIEQGKISYSQQFAERVGWQEEEEKQMQVDAPD